MSDLDESTAYKWTAQAIRSVNDIIEPHIGQQLADSVASAILEAYKKGLQEGAAKQAILEIQGRDRFSLSTFDRP